MLLNKSYLTAFIKNLFVRSIKSYQAENKNTQLYAINALLQM